MRIADKLKNKIREWLSIDLIEAENKRLVRELELTTERNDYIQIQIENINKLFSVGVDVDMRDRHHSWAVVCMEGKPDYVKFIDLSRSEVKDVRNFLRQFEGCNRRRVDSPIWKDLLFTGYEFK